MTRNFTLQQLLFPGIYFCITLHYLYHKNHSAELILLCITLSRLRLLGCTSFWFTLHYIKISGRELISAIHYITVTVNTVFGI